MSTKPALTLEWVEQQEAFHKAALADLEVIRRTLLSLSPSVPANMKVVEVVSPPQEVYGWKKRTLLGVIGKAAGRGLAIGEVVEAARKAGMTEAKTENVSPKLSFYKNTEKLLDLVEGRWILTDKGLGQCPPTEWK